MGTARSLQSAKSKVIRHSTETTTLRTSEGTEARSMMVRGLPSTGTRKSRDKVATMVSRAWTRGNMKAKRGSDCSVFKRPLILM